MTEDTGAGVWIAWRVWHPQQDADSTTLPRLPLDELREHDAEQLKDLRAGNSRAGSRLAAASGAVAVQLWVDVPAGTDRSDERVRARLACATTELCRIVAGRQAAVTSTVTEPVETWADSITRKRTPANAAPTGDVTVDILPEGKAAVVGLEHRVRRSSGDWEDRGAAIMIVVGPDRYGITVGAPGNHGLKGKVPFPNEPLEVRTELHAAALQAEVDYHAEELRTFESSVASALTATTEQDVRSFLSEAQTCLSQRAELEQRVLRLMTLRNKLRESWRAEAFTLTDGATDELLAKLEVQLTHLRTTLIDIPQLLLAAGAWRQAARTEALSLVAAGLVPPTLVVGALGANILPWSDTSDSHALVGMLIIMAASSVVAVLPVRWFVFGISPTWGAASVCRKAGRAVWRLVAATAALAALSWGTCWLLDGTAIRKSADVTTRPHAHTARVAHDSTPSPEPAP
jgi:CorA-like Mg2+ transporter protein